MREVLFRGKRVDNGEWITGNYVKAGYHWHKYGKHEDWIVTSAIQNGGFINLCGRGAVIPETVGQFTGLTDKNGVKIFEGDILKVSYDDGTAYTTEVYAYGSTLCVDIEGEDYDCTAIDFAVDIWKHNCCKWEVVGNVYDNKELLEDKNNG